MIPLQFEFVTPQFFWLFLLLPVAVAWYLWKRNKWTASVKISSLKGFKSGSNLKAKLYPVLLLLRLVAISLLIIAMARPRTVDVTSKIKKTEGIDIVMAIDISASMLARDIKPTRLEALKKVATEFVMGRPNDRIGVVIYAGESYTQTPLTIDKRVVVNGLANIQYTDAIEGGTAIGMGLATSVNRLKDSPSEGRVVILLTDGVNNSGFIDPKIATELAVEFGIKVYTIGLGTTGMAMAPVAINPNGSFQYASIPVEIDEVLLKEIADATGGLYFRAGSNTKLEAIYDEISKLEKTEIEETQFTSYDEKFRPFALFAGLFLLIELLLRFTVYRSFI